jgi:hypothetical protein
MEVNYEGAGWNPKASVKLPCGAKILTVQAQGNRPMIWAEVDPDAVMDETRLFLILNTDAEIPEDKKLSYIGTVQFHNGNLVFHIYEVIS